MLRVEPTGLVSIGQVLCHRVISPSHKKTLQIGELSSPTYPKAKNKTKTKQREKKIILDSHHPVVFASFLVICSLYTLL